MRTRGARYEVYPSLALGEDARFEADGVVGGGLVYEETPIHISLFRSDDQTHPDDNTRRDAGAGLAAAQHYTSGPIISQQVTPQPNVAPESNAGEGGSLG